MQWYLTVGEPPKSLSFVTSLWAVAEVTISVGIHFTNVYLFGVPRRLSLTQLSDDRVTAGAGVESEAFD